jgi:hypothetical protein
MVDLRPLLFINFLMILLLITAGLAPVDTNDQEIAGEATVASVSQDAEHARIDADDDQQGVANPAPSPKDKSSQVLAALKATEDAAFAEEAIFADEVSTPTSGNTALANTTQGNVARGSTDSRSTRPTQRPSDNDRHQDNTKQIETETASEVVSYQNSAPPPPKKPIMTGKLIVRSNVSDDTVLVNGKPYGPTKLELKLTPGSYNIEVAKDGYKGWSTQVDIRRGLTKTLNARLEHYTKVDFANGVWKNDIKTGEGHYIDEGKLEYNGSFVNGKFHGSGSVRYSNGMKYQGEWFEAKMQGQGTLTTTDGDTYIGELDDDQFNGEGTLTKATGDNYTGFWIDGVLNGQGSLTTKGGLLFVGGFSDNLFHGNGSLTYPDGGHYEGSFSNGMFHGKGVETYANGKKYVGQFIDGLYHGKGEILNPNGSKITGTFKDGKAFGKAILTTEEGEVFTARSSEPGVCYRQKSYRATECPELDGW